MRGATYGGGILVNGDQAGIGYRTAYAENSVGGAWSIDHNGIAAAEFRGLLDAEAKLISRKKTRSGSRSRDKIQSVFIKRNDRVFGKRVPRSEIGYSGPDALCASEDEIERSVAEIAVYAEDRPALPRQRGRKIGTYR